MKWSQIHPELRYYVQKWRKADAALFWMVFFSVAVGLATTLWIWPNKPVRPEHEFGPAAYLILIGAALLIGSILGFTYLKSRNLFLACDELLRENRPVGIRVVLRRCEIDDDKFLDAQITPLQPGHSPQNVMFRLPPWEPEAIVGRELEALAFFGAVNGRCYLIRTGSGLLVRQ